MRITPNEVIQQKFRRVLRGYDPHEVDTFLELIKSEMEELLIENGKLQEEIRKLERALEEFREREKSLKNAIMLAQKVKEDIERNAQKEAELIISEAKVKAQEIVNNAQLRSMELIEEIKELKRQKVIFEKNLKNLIETHLKLLEAEEKEEGDEIEAKIEMIFEKTKGKKSTK